MTNVFIVHHFGQMRLIDVLNERGVERYVVLPLDSDDLDDLILKSLFNLSSLQNSRQQLNLLI